MHGHRLDVSCAATNEYSFKFRFVSGVPQTASDFTSVRRPKHLKFLFEGCAAEPFARAIDLTRLRRARTFSSYVVSGIQQS